MIRQSAKFTLGQVVRHKRHPFRGVIFDVDAEFSNSEEWYENIPEASRPRRTWRPIRPESRWSTPTWARCLALLTGRTNTRCSSTLT